MENSITIYGFKKFICYTEAKGLSKVLDAYAECRPAEDIDSLGFNPNSGYVYIALDSGVQICCCLDNEVEYLVTDSETGEEHFFETYDQAINFSNQLFQQQFDNQ